tara:strand:+ start:51 stop:731 length:681 start_codon:yes stop_codon:yes gene_type:complete
MDGLDLARVLTDYDTQRRVIETMVLHDLEIASQLEPKDWIGESFRQQTSRPRKRAVTATLPALLSLGSGGGNSDDDDENDGQSGSTSLSSTRPCGCCGLQFKSLVGQIRALLAAFPGDKSLTTWLILITLYVTDRGVELVCRNTRREAADAYFGGLEPTFPPFETRMTEYLCGKLVSVTGKNGQKTTAVQTASLPPTLAVAKELEILDRIRSLGLLDGRRGSIGTR